MIVGSLFVFVFMFNLLFLPCHSEQRWLTACSAQGNPISWRLLWKDVILYPAIEPHVFRKREDEEAQM